MSSKHSWNVTSLIIKNTKKMLLAHTGTKVQTAQNQQHFQVERCGFIQLAMHTVVNPIIQTLPLSPFRTMGTSPHF